MSRDFPGVRRMLRLTFGRGALDQAIDEELAFHIDTTAEELIGRGMTPEAARAEALRRFGDLGRRRAELRIVDGERDARERWGSRLAAIRQDLGYAIRGVRRSPGFALLVALTLGLGVGVNATMFGILNRLFFQPPAHIVDSERVRRVFINLNFLGRTVTNSATTWSDVQDLFLGRSFSGVAAYSTNDLTFGTGPETTKIQAQIVAPTFFSLLGVHPLLGRPLLPADDSLPNTGSAVVLSYGFWRRQFGGDSQVLGRVLAIGEGRYTVVGVAPDGFTGAELGNVDVWLPLRGAAGEVVGEGWEHGRGYYWLTAIVRLKPGVSTEAAEAEAMLLHRRARAELRDDNDHAKQIILASIIVARGPGRPRETSVYVWVAGVSLIVLLIAGANVANLLLLRAVRRRRETAVRLALGISRTRLVGHLLTESVILALLGGAGALVLGALGGQLFQHMLLWGNSPIVPSLDRTTIAITIGLALLAGIVAGLAPALLESRPDLTRSLKSSGASGRRSRLQSALLILQAMLSVVLLVGAGLFVQSLRQARALDLGMSTSHVLLVKPEFPSSMAPERKTAFLEAGIERLRHLAGVKNVAVSGSIPFWSSYAVDLAVPGLDSLPRSSDGGPYINPVTPDFFSAMSMTLLRGRGFRTEDGRKAPRVVIVGETMARMLWPGQDALGRCMKVGGDTVPCSEVVGVVRDARRQSIFEGASMQYYVPMAQQRDDDYRPAYFVRTSGSPETLSAPVQRALRDESSEVRYIGVRPLQDLIEPQLRSWSLGATLFSLFGGLALVVAAIGLYSIMSFEVTRRTRELGIRSALGASTRELLTLVLGEGMRLVGLGVILGAGVSLLVAPAGADMLYQVSPREPRVYLVAGAVLLGAALLAGILPALRASRVDPNEALRTE